jgi:thiol:disulfide interchange protein DsbD
MGVFLLAVAAYLAGNLTEAKWPWWVVGGVAAGAFAWLGVGAWRMLKTTGPKVMCTIVAVMGILGCVGVASSLADEGPLTWSKFRNAPDAAVQARISRAVGAGRVVVADFTAKWCVNCQFIEKATLNSEAGVGLLTGDDVDLVKVDLTNAGETEGWGVVRQIAGGGGIPLIAVYGPAIEKPIYFQSFFKASDLAEAIAKARGK